MTQDCSRAACCPCAHPVQRLGRIIRMATLDGFVVVRERRFVTIGDRLIWESAERLRDRARDEANCVSDLVFDTSCPR